MLKPCSVPQPFFDSMSCVPELLQRDHPLGRAGRSGSLLPAPAETLGTLSMYRRGSHPSSGDLRSCLCG